MKKSEVFISLRPNKDVQTKRRPTREGKSYKSEANKKSFTFPYQYNKDNIEKKQFLFGECINTNVSYSKDETKHRKRLSKAREGYSLSQARKIADGCEQDSLLTNAGPLDKQSSKKRKQGRKIKRTVSVRKVKEEQRGKKLSRDVSKREKAKKRLSCDCRDADKLTEEDIETLIGINALQSSFKHGLEVNEHVCRDIFKNKK